MRLCFAVWALLSHEAELRRQMTKALKVSNTKSFPEPTAGNGIVRSSRLMTKFSGVMIDASTVEFPRLVKYVALARANH
jgi:hypothetical protein